MAANLLKAGYHPVVFNRTRPKAEALREMGCRVAVNPAEVGAEADIVFTMVSDEAAVEQVISGPDGIVGGMKQGGIVVEMSTVSPECERRLAGLLSERSIQFLDAPVSGGDIGAREGTLAIMAGGDRDAFDKVYPLFQAMGKTITHCGPVGFGQLTKLCNQILVSVTLAAVCEAVAFARNTGLEPDVMLKAVSGGAAGSWQLSNLGPKIASRDYAPGFMVDLMQKDLRIVMETSQKENFAAPATALVHQLFNALQGAGLGRSGTQALAVVWESLGRLNVVSEETD